MKEEPTELYRRFRPKTFSEVVGQNEAVKVLEDKIKNNTVPHALLLSGNSGVGKTTVARILKQELKCGSSDFKEYNAADSRGIDTIRAIREVMGLSPIAGKCRIFLIDEAHRLTGDSMSALLKMLEDCPSHVYFILATTDPDNLLPTIRTRCTHLALKPIHQSEMATLLTDVVLKCKVVVEKKVIEKIIEVSEGSARKALVLLEKVLSLADVDEQLNAIESEAVQKGSEFIAKLLMKKSPWSEIAKALKELQSEDPEKVRRSILGYARVLLLAGQKRAYFLLDAFDGNLFSSGHPGLARCCFYATQITE